MRRGRPKGKSPELHVIDGTDQPCRRRVRIVPQIDGQPIKPKWLKGEASKIFDRYLELFRYRGDNILGAESLLALMCVNEAHIADCARKGVRPDSAAQAEFRRQQAEFFLPPAAQIGRASGAKSATNPFLRHVRTPPSE